MFASAIWEAVSFAIRFLLWVLQCLFSFGTTMTYKAFGSVYAESRVVTWLAAVAIWTILWAAPLAIFGGFEGLVWGVVIGLGWGVFTVATVRGDWERDIAAMPRRPDQIADFGETTEVHASAGPLRPEGFFGARATSDVECEDILSK